ncbi:hypothetical protein RP726_07045 [Candidatus Methylospira mobilis]|uniref:hypothetical protein n=1 Tax=Candidatus Methylospira mobilis TaxID=1808979 RepID=UPI001292D10A|nr:hypothetical protein [Candidatus Methylospira mobilis]WNV06161.1 hypothetical protein RP726_07045 [Candidatus Methylospira mobilis]
MSNAAANCSKHAWVVYANTSLAADVPTVQFNKVYPLPMNDEGYQFEEQWGSI